MLKELFSNRLFIGALAFFVLCVAGSLLYMQHVQRIDAEKLAETEERAKQWNERQNPKPTETEADVAEQTPQGHFHADGTFHTEPHDVPLEINKENDENDVGDKAYWKSQGLTPPPRDTPTFV